MRLSRIFRNVWHMPTSRRHFFQKKQEPLKSGLFGYTSLRTPADFVVLNQTVRKQCDEIIGQLERGRDDRTSVQLMDDLSNTICIAADLVECVRHMHTDKAIVEAATLSCYDFAELVESLNTYKPLYEKLRDSKETEDQRHDEVDKRTLDLFLDDFEQSGIHLPDVDRSEFVRLCGEITDASTHYQLGCDRGVDINRMDQVRYGLGTNHLFTPISHSPKSERRKFVYNTFYRHCPEQEKHLQRMVLCRDDLARLTGFVSYAHRSQYNTLLGSYESARDFLWGVIESCRPNADKEAAVLMDMLVQTENTMGRSVAEWDINYLATVYKEKSFGQLQQMAVARLLTAGNLVAGFSRLTEKIYGVRLVETQSQPGEMWDATTVRLEAMDGENNVLGTIYLDPVAREKSLGDCHHTVRCSKELEDGSWQSPVVVVSMSMIDDESGDWHKQEVSAHSATTLFHELGHAMHSILGRTRYQHVAGTRCPQDFSEIPSHLMEHFFDDMRVMRSVLQTTEGDCVTVQDAAAIIARRHAFTSLDTVQHAAYALFDLELHGPSVPPRLRDGSLTTTQFFHSILTQAMPYIDRDPNAAFQHRFHHIVTYGSRYYSYLVARAGASLVWNNLFAKDPFSRHNGLKWAEVQSNGGGLPSSVLLSSVLGYAPNDQHLISALKQQTDTVSNLDAVSV